MKYFQDSGNDIKSGKLSSGMGGRFIAEWVAGLSQNLHSSTTPCFVPPFRDLLS